MSLIQAVILGIVEGLTEFLPISSTAHLIVVSDFLGLSQNEFTSFFEVFIQSGAILAVVILYFEYLRSHQKLIKPLYFSFLPTAIVGVLLHPLIKNTFFNSPFLIYSSLVLVGVVFIIVEFFITKRVLKLHKAISNLSIKEAILVGVFQSLAIVPGVSRAGAVMVGMMIRGYKREDAAIYSFLLAVPTIFGASVLDFLKTDLSIFSHASNTLTLVIGFVTSFITAYIVIKWFISFIQKNTLTVFGIYRIVLGLGLLLL